MKERMKKVSHLLPFGAVPLEDQSTSKVNERVHMRPHSTAK
jgi:hypothetical protein